MKNRDEEFENLPFEWQMKILNDRQRQRAILANIDEVLDRVFLRMSKLRDLKECQSVEEGTRTCFVMAETFDGLPMVEGDEGYSKETAKEFDFLRHLLQYKDRPLKRMQFAVDAIEALTSDDFEEADTKASIAEFDNDAEYKSIVDYWTEVTQNAVL